MTTTVPPSVTDRNGLLQTQRALKLSGMLDTLDARLAQAAAGQLGHLEFLQVLCQDEITRRDATAMTRRLRRAHFPEQATLEGFDFTANPKLPAAQIRDLAALRWLTAGEHVILYGPIGVGKTHIAQALGHQAVRGGADVRFTTLSRALADLAGGHADAGDDEPGECQTDLVGRPDRPREEPVRPVMRPQRRQARADEHPAHCPPPARGEHPDDERPKHPERRRCETRPETLQQHRERNRYRDIREHRRPLFRVATGSVDAPATSPPSWPFTPPPHAVIPPADTRKSVHHMQSNQSSSRYRPPIPIKKTAKL